jgi:hypothetical protein
VQACKACYFLSQLLIAFEEAGQPAALHCLARLLSEVPACHSPHFPELRHVAAGDSCHTRADYLFDRIKSLYGKLTITPFPPGLVHGSSEFTVTMATALSIVARLSATAFSRLGRRVIGSITECLQTSEAGGKPAHDLDAVEMLLAGVFEAVVVHAHAINLETITLEGADCVTGQTCLQLRESVDISAAFLRDTTCDAVIEVGFKILSDPHYSSGPIARSVLHGLGMMLLVSASFLEGSNMMQQHAVLPRMMACLHSCADTSRPSGMYLDPWWTFCASMGCCFPSGMCSNACTSASSASGRSMTISAACRHPHACP